MLRFILLLLTLWSASLPWSAAQDLSLYQYRHFVGATGDTLPYRILLPKNYASGKRYPLLLFLHGAGERGRDNALQLTHGASLFIRPDVRAKYPAIVVFPQCPKDQYWASVVREPQRQHWDFPLWETPGAPMALLLEWLDALVQQERVDARRLYVAGLSMGGMGTFELLARQPHRFAAAIPICGGGNALAVPLYARHTALWVFHGDADAVVPVALSRKMVQAIRAAGGRVRYTEYANVNHDSWTPAFAEPDLLKWLFSQRLKGNARY